MTCIFNPPLHVFFYFNFRQFIITISIPKVAVHSQNQDQKPQTNNQNIPIQSIRISNLLENTKTKVT